MTSTTARVDRHLFRRTLRRAAGIVGLTLTIGGNSSAFAQGRTPPAIVSAADSWSFADIADVYLDAPVVARLRIAEAIVVPPEASRPARPGTIRYYLIGDTIALIRGAEGLAPRVAWLADVPVDPRGRPPRLRRAEVLVSALPVPGRPGEIRLAAPDAMPQWSPSLDARVRAVIAAGLATDAPPRITGVSGAFHSPGNLPGESETQIFLATPRGQPVSLSVLRRPSEQPRWAVALGEIVDEAARPPARDTLGWYRLACFLPATLPPRAITQLAAADAAAAEADYRYVLGALGPCTRSRDAGASASAAPIPRP